MIVTDLLSRWRVRRLKRLGYQPAILASCPWCPDADYVTLDGSESHSCKPQ